MANDKATSVKEGVHRFDLEERTAKFGEAVIMFAQQIVKSDVSKPLIGQLVRSGTSVGANYCEADSAHTRKDFFHKIAICKKESRETKHWLRMMALIAPVLRPQARELWQEANELNLIFSAIINRHRKKEVSSF